jgi:hypothetical protein
MGRWTSNRLPSVIGAMVRTRLGLSGRSMVLTFALVVAFTFGDPVPAEAQAGGALLGAAAGAAAGSWWFLSLSAARARSGEVLLTRSDVLPTLIPTVGIGIVAGLSTGIWEKDRLGPALGWGLVGWASGFGLGYMVGDAIWEDDSGKWAGAVIGAGAGLAIGALIGGITSMRSEADHLEQGSALFSLQHSVRIGR